MSQLAKALTASKYIYYKLCYEFSKQVIHRDSVVFRNRKNWDKIDSNWVNNGDKYYLSPIFSVSNSFT